MHRIVKPNGKVLLKLNPYITEGEIEEYKLEKISDEFYKEPFGLFLYNLTNERVEKILYPYFTIEKYQEIQLDGNINRMYYLANKD